MRCFVALDLPETHRAQLVRVVEQLSRLGAAVRWVGSGNLHLTLKFLGDCDEAQVAGMRAAVRALPTTRLPLALSGLGCFPPRGRPRVIWAGLVGAVQEVGELAAALEDAAAKLGIPREKRAFRGHVTLGRVKGPGGLKELEQAIARRGLEVRSEALAAPSITLYQSELRPEGAAYSVVERLELPG